MPSLTSFRIEFDRASGTYAPSEAVSGRVIIHLTERRLVREVRVSIKGEASVQWTRKQSERDSNKRVHDATTHYSASEEYFHFLYVLLSPDVGRSEVELRQGRSEYAFRFQLPSNIPCSFEHQHGHVRYTVKAVIDRPWKFDHQCKSAFTVVTPYNLNVHPESSISVHDDINNEFSWCCCFNRGSMKGLIKIPFSGYVPGQWINATVSFTNYSDRVRVTKLCIKLEQTIKCHASRPHSDTKSTTTVVASDKKAGPFNSHEELFSRLSIPALPPSSLEYCRIIELDYKLCVTIHVSGLHCSITKRYPILIGTVPLHSTAIGPNPQLIRPTAPWDNSNEHPPVPFPMPPPMPVPTAPVSQPQITEPPLPYPYPGTHAVGPIGFSIHDQPSTSQINWDMSPPSYEECMSRTENIREHGESDYVRGANEPFAPRYPVFTFPPPDTLSK